MSRLPAASKPEPNFGRFITDEEIGNLSSKPHALARFVERLQPGIPGADVVAARLHALEVKRERARLSGSQYTQLQRDRTWLTQNVGPHVFDLIAMEGFWATSRPQWSRSQTPSEALLQVGGLCLFPVAFNENEWALKTCVNGSKTWEEALARGFTLAPKPLFLAPVANVRPRGWLALAGAAWRSRGEHGGFLHAWRSERAVAVADAAEENARRAAEHEARRSRWDEQRRLAYAAFRERHAAPQRLAG